MSAMLSLPSAERSFLKLEPNVQWGVKALAPSSVKTSCWAEVEHLCPHTHTHLTWTKNFSISTQVLLVFAGCYKKSVRLCATDKRCLNAD